MFGFCCSEKELLTFEKIVTMERSLDYFTFRMTAFGNICLTIWIKTHGQSMFYDMGMIAIITNGNVSTKKIADQKVLGRDILKNSHIPIIEFNEKAVLAKG